MAETQAKKPWYKSWTKIGILTGILTFVVPILFAGVNWVVTAIGNHAVKAVRIEESQAQLNVNTSDVTGLKQSVGKIDSTLDVFGEKLSNISDNMKDIKDQNGKELWYLMDLYKDRMQSKGATTRPFVEARANKSEVVDP